ncbi:MAG: xanthine dehydrogenase family protein molybdopterin-binding subunit [Hyphomicrobiaceae bacterium]
MTLRTGKGWAACYLKVGMLRSQDASSAVIELKQDGSIVVAVGSVEVGAGTTTVAAQIAAEELGVAPESVTVVYGDTDTTPYDGGTVGSRSTYIMGNAVRRAARDVRDALFQTAAEEFEVSPDDLEVDSGFVRVRGTQDKGIAIGDLAFLTLYDRRKIVIGRGTFQPETGRVALVGGKSGFRRDATIMDLETGQGNPVAAFGYAAAHAEVEVDDETGVVKVRRLIVATDCGRAINPLLLEGQLQGSIVMGIDHALHEDTRPDCAGDRRLTLDLTEYAISTALDPPEIISIIVECPDPHGPFGAKGAGEIDVILPGPAICNAIYDAVGVRLTSLPATPEKILAGIKQKGGVSNESVPARSGGSDLGSR